MGEEKKPESDLSKNDKLQKKVTERNTKTSILPTI